MDNIVYKLNEKSNSIVDKSIDQMDAWLKSLSEEQLTDWHRVCNKGFNEMSEEEIELIQKYSIVLYYRELDITELSINEELIADISARFCVNIIVESLRRRGFAEPQEPLLLYKESKINLTEKGKKFNKENLD